LYSFAVKRENFKAIKKLNITFLFRVRKKIETLFSVAEDFEVHKNCEQKIPLRSSLDC